MLCSWPLAEVLLLCLSAVPFELNDLLELLELYDCPDWTGHFLQCLIAIDAITVAVIPVIIIAVVKPVTIITIPLSILVHLVQVPAGVPVLVIAIQITCPE